MTPRNGVSLRFPERIQVVELSPNLTSGRFAFPIKRDQENLGCTPLITGSIILYQGRQARGSEGINKLSKNLIIGDIKAEMGETPPKLGKIISIKIIVPQRVKNRSTSMASL